MILVYEGNPRTLDETGSASAVIGITGHSMNQVSNINKEQVYWGALPADPKMLDDVDRALKEDLIKSNVVSISIIT